MAGARVHVEIVDRNKNSVRPAAQRNLGDQIGCLGDIVNIVAIATNHSIIASTAIERVITALTENRIVAFPAVQPIVAKTATDGVVADQTEKKIIGIVADQAVR